MTNVNHSDLIKLCKATLGGYSRLGYERLYSTLSMMKSEMLNYGHIDRNQSYLVRRNFSDRKDSDDNESNPNSGQNKKESYSSFHQQYNRRSYERKKFNHQNRNDENNSQTSNNQNTNLEVNHYQRLNVPPDADVDTIKSAYYSLSKLYHPDIVGAGNKVATENFRLITESYDTLSDPESRIDYDKKMNIVTQQEFYMDEMNSFNPARDADMFFKRRNAEMFVRNIQEAAFLREKADNPRKFRSGVFKQDVDDVRNNYHRLFNLDRRLNELNKTSRWSKSGSESDFYRMHLYDTVLRQRKEMREHPDIYQSTSDSNNDSIPAALAVVGLILLGVVVVGVNQFIDIDLAAMLDAQLEEMYRKAQAEKEEAAKIPKSIKR